MGRLNEKIIRGHRFITDKAKWNLVNKQQYVPG